MKFKIIATIVVVAIMLLYTLIYLASKGAPVEGGEAPVEYVQ